MVRHIRVYIPIVIVIASYQVAQMYEFWNVGGTTLYNWTLFGKECAMTIAWNIKFISEEVCRVLEGLAILLTVRKLSRFVKNPTEDQGHFLDSIRVVWQVYFIYRCLDVVYYFINFKTEWYNSIWFVLAAVEYFIIKNRKKA